MQVFVSIVESGYLKVAVKKTIKVDTKELKSYARRVARREANLRPVWGKIFDELADAHTRNFQTGGSAVGGWAPLTPRYFNEKFAQGYGRSKMVRTGTLQEALSGFRGRGSETAQKPKSAFWGIDTSPDSPISYASFHQMGTRKMHERQIVFVPKTFARNAGDMIAEHIIMDTGPRGSRSRLRGLFDV